MDAATVSALASSVSACAAWFAFGTATHRAKKDWQRTTVLQCAVTILQQCQQRHNREHTLLEFEGDLTSNEFQAARAELSEITDRVQKAHIQLALVAAPQVVKASSDILDLMQSLDADLFFFEHDHPQGGKYDGRMYCMESLIIGKGSVEAALSRAISQHASTSVQRLSERVRRRSRKRPSS
ncbi:hypothetical protein L2K20_06015 [Mycobacterium sp. MBM]|nr:hypothetical protein [Mycobacterium sp. MBM]